MAPTEIGSSQIANVKGFVPSCHYLCTVGSQSSMLYAWILLACLILDDRLLNLPERSFVWWLWWLPLKLGHPRLLMSKALFLLATTSARSGLRAPCCMHGSSFSHWEPFINILALNPAFQPKTATEVALSVDINLSAFFPEHTSPLE